MMCGEERLDPYHAATRVPSEYTAFRIDPDPDSDSDPEKSGGSNNSFQRTRRHAAGGKNALRHTICGR